MSILPGLSARKTTLLAAVAILSALSATAVSGQQPATHGRSILPPAGTLVAPGEAPSLAILFTGDVIGYVDPCG
jgi:hypothetical protein